MFGTSSVERKHLSLFLLTSAYSLIYFFYLFIYLLIYIFIYCCDDIIAALNIHIDVTLR